MITKLWCFIWGHKTVINAFTGEAIICYDPIGEPVTRDVYTLKRLKFCKRCGADCHEEEIETK